MTIYNSKIAKVTTTFSSLISLPFQVALHTQDFAKTLVDDDFVVFKRSFQAVFYGPAWKEGGIKSCYNCKTTRTCFWRKVDGESVCNVCGIQYKLHGLFPFKVSEEIKNLGNSNSDFWILCTLPSYRLNLLRCSPPRSSIDGHRFSLRFTFSTFLANIFLKMLFSLFLNY